MKSHYPLGGFWDRAQIARQNAYLLIFDFEPIDSLLQEMSEKETAFQNYRDRVLEVPHPIL